MERDFSDLRETMVRVQIEARGIEDPAVLSALRAVPREQFVPPELRRAAYEDVALPIAGGQTISQPFIVALMAEALQLEPGDRVLEIGTGSGYFAAILSQLAREVFTVERLEELALSARETLQTLGYRRIHVRCGDGSQGWPEEAPFEAIAVTAGGPRIPAPLSSQLAVGGRLVIPVGPERTLQNLVRVTRTTETEYETESITAVRFVPLIGTEGWGETDAGE